MEWGCVVEGCEVEEFWEWVDCFGCIENGEGECFEWVVFEGECGSWCYGWGYVFFIGWEGFEVEE